MKYIWSDAKKVLWVRGESGELRRFWPWGRRHKTRQFVHIRADDAVLTTFVAGKKAIVYLTHRGVIRPVRQIAGISHKIIGKSRRWPDESVIVLMAGESCFFIGQNAAKFRLLPGDRLENAEVGMSRGLAYSFSRSCLGMYLYLEGVFVPWARLKAGKRTEDPYPEYYTDRRIGEKIPGFREIVKKEILS